MPTKSYLLAIGDLSMPDRQAIRGNCDQLLLRAAEKLAIRANDDDLIIRDCLPGTDLGLVANQDDWLVAGAGVQATELQYIGSQLSVDKCVAFFGVSFESAPNDISRLRLTLGAASGQIRGVYQVEQLNSRLEPVGYFSEPVVFIRQEYVRILVMPRVAFVANSQRVALLSRTIEPIGATVSAPSV